jgi:hypothetical protein
MIDSGIWRYPKRQKCIRICSELLYGTVWLQSSEGFDRFSHSGTDEKCAEKFRAQISLSGLLVIANISATSKRDRDFVPGFFSFGQLGILINALAKVPEFNSSIALLLNR